MAGLLRSAAVNPPGIIGQALQATVAAGRWGLAGFPIVTTAEHLARAVECSLCDTPSGPSRWGWDAIHARCLHCGCTSLKLWLATERCPLRKW